MNSDKHDAITEISTYIEKKLRSLSMWQIVKLILSLGLICGALFGFLIGQHIATQYTNDRLYQIANQPKNIIELNDELFEISPITASCSKILAEDGIVCTITNQRTNATEIIFI